VTSAAYYGPRRDFDPVTLACKGLLVEEQRTNLWTNSNDFSAGSWVASSATPTLNNAISPDGTMNAALITLSGAGGDQYIGGYATLTGTYTSSFWIKASDAGQVGKTLRFDTTGAGTANATITLTASWQRITLTNAPAGYFQVRLISASGFTASAFHLYGAQLEAGSFATSYIPVGSTTAGATRNADVASVSTQAFPYSATEGTWVANFQTIFTGAAPLTAWIVGADNSNSKRIMYMPATDDRVRSFDGSTEIIATGDATGAITKSAAAFGPTDRALVTNGGTVATGAVAAGYGTASVATLGSSNSLSALNGHIRQITYLPRRISNTELQTRTA
jgi:hypothetical protein